MADREVLATALAMAKAMQGASAPLTVNGVVYDGTRAVELTVGAPTIVSSVEEMTDPDRAYVLEATGTVWVNRYREGYVNQLPLATSEPGGDTVFGEGKGYAYPYRISSSTGTQKDGGQTYLTGYIPVNGNSKIRLRGFYDAVEGGYGCFVFMYEADGGYSYDVNNQENTFLSRDTYWVQTDEAGKEWEVTLTNPDARYIRVQAEGLDEGAIITVDQEIGDTEGGGYEWVDTGVTAYGDNSESVLALEERTTVLEKDAANSRKRLTALEKGSDSRLPSWWEEYLPERIAAIRAHQDEGGWNAFSFLVMTDIHESGNLGRRTGAVAKRVMDGCGASFAVELGDSATRTAVETREEMESSMEAAREILAPLGDRLLRTRGNHDGFWGIETGADGSQRYYGNGYTDREIWNRVFRSGAAAQKGCFDADGVGYYVDDEVHKARFVVLNTSREGCSMGVYRYGQSQFDLMVRALMTLPDEEWCILFFSHVPPVKAIDYEGDGVSDGDLSGEIPEQALLRGLVKAFIRREPLFSGEYGEAGAWDRVSLELLDFSEAKGRFAGYFAGHLHGDMIFDDQETYPFPVIVTRCDAPVEEESLHGEVREEGTVSEHSFDAVTVVRTSQGRLTVYLDKIGAGEDRVLTVS